MTVDCSECVTMLSGRRVFMVVRQWAHSDQSGEIGTVYFDEQVALRARDPGEAVIELRLAVNGADSAGASTDV